MKIPIKNLSESVTKMCSKCLLAVVFHITQLRKL